MNFVADTLALLWWFTDSPKISATASEIFDKYERGENIIFIPSIVVAELLSIFDKKRISFNFKNLFKKIHTSENFFLIALDYPILQKMVALKEVPELHDKIIASTAKYLNVPIITKDKVLQKIASVRAVWLLYASFIIFIHQMKRSQSFCDFSLCTLRALCEISIKNKNPIPNSNSSPLSTLNFELNCPCESVWVCLPR